MSRADRLALTARASSANEIFDLKAMTQQIFTGKLPSAEKHRAFHGSDIDMAILTETLRQADVGVMTPLTDLARETMALDPHQSSIAQKRFGSIAKLEVSIDPASGNGLNPATALEITEMVRAKIKALRNFRTGIQAMAWALYDGRGALEVQWDRRQGRFPWSPTQLDWIHPRRIGIGVDRELRIINTFNSGMGWWTEHGAALHDYPGKFLTGTPSRFGDYIEREGLARRSMYWAYFKRYSARMRMALHELFAVPWRMIEFGPDTEFTTTDSGDLDLAEEKAEELGSSSVIAVKNASVKLGFPPHNTGEIFLMTHKECDEQHSKLWLGNTGTTDMKADALGGGATEVAKGEQNIFLELDAIWLAEDVLQDQLVDVLVSLNCGPAWLPYAPKITLRAKSAIDHAAEQARRDKAMSSGVPIGEDDYYKSANVPKPGKDENKFVKVAGTTNPDGTPGAAQVVLIDKTGQDITPKPTPSTPSAGAGPAALPGASAEPPPPGAGTASDTDPSAPAQGAEDGPGGSLSALKDALGLEAQRLALASSPHPVVNGSPDQIVERGVKEGARIVGAWVQAFLEAIDEDDDRPTETSLHRSLAKAEADLSIDAMARSLEKTIIRSLMLGSLDSAWEVEADKPLAVATFTERAGDGDPLRLSAVSAAELAIPKFTTKPFQEAISSFLGKKVLPRRVFDRLSAEAKRRSFTVAGLAKKEMLAVAHDELGKSIIGGEDLRAFRSRLADRFESAGWTPLNKSHVETVFRNATAGAYASGRHAQMTLPEVLAARPYWQILGVDDDRTRKPHAAAHKKVLLASDPFWTRTGGPPFGMNCRCRRISRSADDLTRLKLTVSTGSDLKGLPDEGWENQSVLLDRATWDFSAFLLERDPGPNDDT